MSSSAAAAADSCSAVRVLGVCGGIGSGKSQACRLLVSELGCMAHIDADSVAHSVYKPGSKVVYEIVDAFGSDVLAADKPKGEEEIDRKKLGPIVFADPKAMSTLEGIVWPHMKEEIRSRIDQLKQDYKNDKKGVIVLEAAVLLDAGLEDLLDGLWVVRAPPDVAVQRLVQYRSFTADDANKRIEAQKVRRGIGNIEEEIQKGVVTAVIDNTGGLEELQKALLEKLNDDGAWKQ